MGHIRQANTYLADRINHTGGKTGMDEKLYWKDIGIHRQDGLT